MNPHVNKKICQECGDEIKGRIDKKFCSEGCRYTFNNKIKSENHKNIAKINQILSANRKILSGLNPSGKTTVSEKKLTDAGFNFNYFTSIYKTKTGNTYHFCYEQGYLALDKNYYMLVVWKDEETK